MDKFFYLVFQKTKTLLKTSPLVFTVFMLVQSVTAFSYIFFYSTVVKSRADYIAAYDSMRQITVTLPTGFKAPDGIINNLVSNGVAAPTQVCFYFYAGGAKSKQLHAFLHPEKENGTVSGSAISQDDINRKALVIIPANEDKQVDIDPAHNEKHNIGDSVVVNGRKFYAKGIRHGGILDEIPYSTGLALYRLNKIEILMPAGLTDAQKQQTGSYYGALLNAVDVTLPKPMAQKLFVNLFLPFVASAFIGIIAILNFIFLYRFMLEKCRRDFTLLRLCGCSRKRSLALLFCQLIMLFTESYIISLLAYKLFKLTGGIFTSASISILGCLAIYLTFMLIIVLLILPFALNFFKKSIISGEKLLS